MDGLRAQTYQCLFGLLAVTGLRISEAIALELRDVDLQHGVLTIAKIRSGGQQTVVVQHVNVGDGGRAMVAGQVRARPTEVEGEPGK